MWEYIIIVIASAALIGLLIHARKVQRLEVGGLYSVFDGSGQFGVVKLLAFDSRGVHICLYKNRFKRRPSSIDPQSLTLGTIHEPGVPGIGHLPILKKEFFRWFPLHIGQAPVTEEELDGYKLWRETNGDYWDSPPEISK